MKLPVSFLDLVSVPLLFCQAYKNPNPKQTFPCLGGCISSISACFAQLLTAREPFPRKTWITTIAPNPCARHTLSSSQTFAFIILH